MAEKVGSILTKTSTAHDEMTRAKYWREKKSLASEDKVSVEFVQAPFRFYHRWFAQA